VKVKGKKEGKAPNLKGKSERRVHAGPLILPFTFSLSDASVSPKTFDLAFQFLPFTFSPSADLIFHLLPFRFPLNS
jgi:hypothetical protein